MFSESVLLCPARLTPVSILAFLCKRPNLLRTLLRERAKSFLIKDTAVCVRACVLISGRLSCGPGCHRQCQHSQCCSPTPSPSTLLPAPYEAEAYAPPLLYLFIEQAAVSLMRVRCTAVRGTDSRISPYRRVLLLPLAPDAPAGVEINAVLVPTSSSC